MFGDKLSSSEIFKAHIKKEQEKLEKKTVVK